MMVGYTYKFIKNALLAILLVFGNYGSAVASTKNPPATKRAPAKKVAAPAPKAPAKKAPAAPKVPAKKGAAPAPKAPGKKAPGKKVAAPAPKTPGKKAPVAPKAPAKKGAAPAPKAPEKKAPAAPKAPAKKAVAPAKGAKAPGKPAVRVPPVKPVPPPIVPVVVGSDPLQRFQKNPHASALFCTSLEPNDRANPLSNIYQNALVNFSKAPKLHAYHGSALELLSVKLPGSVQRNLPKGIENDALAVLPQLYFVISTAEHPNQDPLFEQLSLRPNYLVHADAPDEAKPTYVKNTMLHAAIFDGQGQSLGFDDLKPQNGPFVRAKVVTHPYGGELIVSPPNLKIHGAQPGLSRSYYSSFYTEENPSLAAVTYHWVVGHNDIQEVYNALLTSPTFREFRDTMRVRWQRKIKGAMVRELDDLLNGLY
jgi:hypothetical protein